jgi:hypothetical protein
VRPVHRVTTLPPSISRLSKQPYGPAWPVTGISLPFECTLPVGMLLILNEATLLIHQLQINDTVMDLTKPLPGSSSVSTFKHATIEECRY